MKTKTLLICAVTLLAGTMFCPIAQATAIDTLVITENSSTDLTVVLTLAGVTTHPTATLTPGFSSDRWLIPVPAGTVGLGINNWVEPGNSGKVNTVDAFGSVTFPNTITVISDVSNPAGGLPDGVIDMTNFKLNGVSLWVAFIDHGDAVPDTGSTLGLLLLALAALFGASRVRSLRAA